MLPVRCLSALRYYFWFGNILSCFRGSALRSMRLSYVLCFLSYFGDVLVLEVVFFFESIWFFVCVGS